MQECPVIAVGGSYGGMLSAWMRMKYPNIIDAALAASAPILQFEGTVVVCLIDLTFATGTGVSEEIFSTITTQDFANVSASCPNGFRQVHSCISSSFV